MAAENVPPQAPPASAFATGHRLGQYAILPSTPASPSAPASSRFFKPVVQAPVVQARAVDVVPSPAASEVQAQTESREEPHENDAGLPDGLPGALKAGVETLSGHALDDVRVHYNSARPTQIQALAFAQGSDIHLGVGQERHLPHEAWHVVQQKQGRVPATLQAKGLPLNDSPALEREADVMGDRAVSLGAARLGVGGGVVGRARKARSIAPLEAAVAETAATDVDPWARPGTLSLRPVQRAAVGAVVQRLKKDAQKYVDANSLGITASREAVETYVNDAKNPKENRIGLLRAWNKKQNGINALKAPPDLAADKVAMTSLSDFSDWDSDDEDNLDIAEVVKTKKKRDLTLMRGGDKDKDKGKSLTVPLLDMSDAIKLCRQIVKRNEYKLHLPIVTQIGPSYIEYASPGTDDVYATPLVPIKGSSDTFKRAGTSSDYNFKNLTGGLEREARDSTKSTAEKGKEAEGSEENQEAEDSAPKQKKRKLDTVLKTFSGESSGGLTEAEAEAIAAISCDFMKGSSAMEFVMQAQKHAEKEGGVTSFSDYFMSDDPAYGPAAKGGRGRVVEKTKQAKARKQEQKKLAGEVGHLINVNNCLINALALGSLRRNANLIELIAIRTRLGNVGEMMVASPHNVGVIREVLGITSAVTVHYDIARDGTPNEDIPGAGGDTVHIFHTGGDHFVHLCPDKSRYDLGE
jgi:hypothetical protein